jgi:hypothetical protein
MRRKEVDGAKWSAFLGRFVSKADADGKVPAGRISLSRLDNAVKDRMGHRASAKRDAATKRRGNARAQMAKYLSGNSAPLPPRAFYIGEALRGLGESWCSGFITLGVAGYVGERIALQEAMDQQDALQGVFLWCAAFAEPHLDDEDDLNRKAAEVTLSVSWDAIGDEAMKRAWETAGKASFRPKGLAADLLSIYERTTYNDEGEREEAFAAVFEVWRKRHPLVPHIEEMVGKRFPFVRPEWSYPEGLTPAAVVAALMAPEKPAAGRRTSETESPRRS